MPGIPRYSPSSRAGQHTGLPSSLRSEPYCVVVAHPDDEILWASSIIENAEKVIICFSGSPEDPRIAYGRRSLQEDFPLKNAIFLNIPEASISNEPVKLSVEAESRVGLCGFKNEVEYAASFYEILSCLHQHLSGCGCVFTHAPWGEYGHVEHVQVHKAVAEVCASHGFQLWFFSYLTKDTYSYMRQHLAARGSWDSFLLPTDRLLYDKLKKIYQDNCCWTWDDDYVPPRYDGFIRLLPNSASSLDTRIERQPLYLSLLWSLRLRRSKRRFLSVFRDPDSPWMRLNVLLERLLFRLTLRYPGLFGRIFQRLI